MDTPMLGHMTYFRISMSKIKRSACLGMRIAIADKLKGGAYPRPRMVARVVTTLQLFAAETCNKFLKIEHHDSIVYSKHELILTFLAGATSDFTAGNTTQERLDLPARFLQQILLLPYFTMLQRVLLDFDFTFPFTNLF